ncbi:MAG: hypothetical protein ACM3VW_02135 [Bacteroidota bacterium]
MADTKTQAEDKVGLEDTAAKPGPRPAGITSIPSGGARIGFEPNPLSKGQRRHLRRQKEAGKIKVTNRRSQVSR